MRNSSLLSSLRTPVSIVAHRARRSPMPPQNKDAATVRKLIKEGCYVNAAQGDGMTR